MTKAGSESDIEKISEISLADEDIEIGEYENSVDLDPEYNEDFKKPQSSSSIIDRLLAEESFNQSSDAKVEKVPVTCAAFRRASVDKILTNVQNVEIEQVESDKEEQKRSYDFSDLSSPKSTLEQEAFFGKTVVMAGHDRLQTASARPRKEPLKSEQSEMAKFRRASIEDTLVDVSEFHFKQTFDTKSNTKCEYNFDDLSSPKSPDTQEAFFGKTEAKATNESIYDIMAKDIHVRKQNIESFETADNRVMAKERTYPEQVSDSNEEQVDIVIAFESDLLKQKSKNKEEDIVENLSKDLVTKNFLPEEVIEPSVAKIEENVIPLTKMRNTEHQEGFHSRQKSLNDVVDQLINEIEEKFKDAPKQISADGFVLKSSSRLSAVLPDKAEATRLGADAYVQLLASQQSAVLKGKAPQYSADQFVLKSASRLSAVLPDKAEAARLGADAYVQLLASQQSAVLKGKAPQYSADKFVLRFARIISAVLQIGPKVSADAFVLSLATELSSVLSEQAFKNEVQNISDDFFEGDINFIPCNYRNSNTIFDFFKQVMQEKRERKRVEEEKSKELFIFSTDEIVLKAAKVSSNVLSKEPKKSADSLILENASAVSVVLVKSKVQPSFQVSKKIVSKRDVEKKARFKPSSFLSAKFQTEKVSKKPNFPVEVKKEIPEDKFGKPKPIKSSKKEVEPEKFIQPALEEKKPKSPVIDINPVKVEKKDFFQAHINGPLKIVIPKKK